MLKVLAREIIVEQVTIVHGRALLIAHPEPFENSDRFHVRRVGRGEHPWEAERLEP
jgi:rRNA maturation protein Nop10